MKGPTCSDEIEELAICLGVSTIIYMGLTLIAVSGLGKLSLGKERRSRS